MSFFKKTLPESIEKEIAELAQYSSSLVCRNTYTRGARRGFSLAMREAQVLVEILNQIKEKYVYGDRAVEAANEALEKFRERTGNP